MYSFFVKVILMEIFFIVLILAKNEYVKGNEVNLINRN